MLGKSGLSVPQIAVGCMRLNELDLSEAEHFLNASLDAGANFFDHADIYGRGTCESFFAKAIHMSPARREQLIIQSKCGIVPGIMFDFSKEHIIQSVEGSLQRLQTDYLDVLLLHRPDALMEPEEVAAAFDELSSTGKVRHFGVSNQNPYQMQLLQKAMSQPIVANQLQLSITNATMITAGLHVNMLDETAVGRDGGVLDYCRLNDITIQPWSPFQFGFFDGVFLGHPDYAELNYKIAEISEKYDVTATTIVMAWLLRHPAKMMPITGTTKTARLLDCIKAMEIQLTREEWYALLMAAGNILP